jgi:hypothetical protein
VGVIKAVVVVEPRLVTESKNILALSTEASNPVLPKPRFFMTLRIRTLHLAFEIFK